MFSHRRAADSGLWKRTDDPPLKTRGRNYLKSIYPLVSGYEQDGVWRWRARTTVAGVQTYLGVWADELDAARAVQQHLLQQIEKVAPMLQILSNSLSCNLTTNLHAASAAKQESEQAHCSQETQDAPAEVLGGKGTETAATACAADHLPLLRERPPPELGVPLLPPLRLPARQRRGTTPQETAALQLSGPSRRFEVGDVVTMVIKINGKVLITKTADDDFWVPMARIGDTHHYIVPGSC